MPSRRTKKSSLPPSMANCTICVMREECIRCSSLSQVDPKHPEKLRELVASNIYRTPPSPEAQARMDAGTAAHKELEIRRAVDTNPESVIRRIRNKETFYFSLSFCSVRYGLRGTVDAVLCDWQGDTLRFLIIDDKSVPGFEPTIVRRDGRIEVRRFQELFPFNDEEYHSVALHGFEVPTMTGDWQIAWRPVSKVIRYFVRDMPLYKITTSSGRELTATPNHSFLVYDTLTNDWTVSKVDGIKLGSRLPSPRYLPHQPSFLEALDVRQFTRRPAYLKERQYFIGRRTAIPAVWSITPELAYFLGLWIADGSMASGRLEISNRDPSLLDACSTFARSIGVTVDRDQPHDRSPRVLFYSEIMKEIVESMCCLPKRAGKKGKGTNAVRKKVPDFIYNCEPQVIAAFLRGYFDGDGTAKGTVSRSGSVAAHSTSKFLIHGVSTLLSLIGIANRLTYVNSRAESGYFAVKLLGTEEYTKFAKSVGFTGNKRHDLEMTIATQSGKRRKQLIDSFPISNNLDQVVSNPSRSSKYHSVGMSAIADLRFKDATLGKKIANSGVIFDEVVKIEAVQYTGDLYDFEVPGTENFVAGYGNVVTHNTHVSGPVFKQLWAYGMILSDPHCLYTKSIDGEGEEVERKPFYQAIGDLFESLEVWTTINPYASRGQIVDRPLPAKPFSRGRVFVDKGLVFAVLRSKRKLINAFSEPAILAASQQMKFKRSGNQLVLYEPKK